MIVLIVVGIILILAGISRRTRYYDGYRPLFGWFNRPRRPMGFGGMHHGFEPRHDHFDHGGHNGFGPGPGGHGEHGPGPGGRH